MDIGILKSKLKPTGRLLSISATAWLQLDPAWKFALATFLAMRVALGIWSFAIWLLFPVAIQNLDLFGTPVLTAFDTTTSARYVYSRELDGQTLTFRTGAPGSVVDVQTGSVWSLSEGRAVMGQYAGRAFTPAPYSVEDVFPYGGVAGETTPLLSMWQRFDTNVYVSIAVQGYTANGSTVYLPFYPFLIRILSMVFSPLVAALIISNLALIGVLVLLYHLSTSLFDHDTARRTLAYLLLFPTAFFLSAGYTESLFLLCTLGAFVAAKREQWLYAVLLGLLAALTRLQGVLIVLPLAYLWWKQRTRNATWVRGASLLMIPAATGAFLALTNLSLLTTYEGQLHARFVWPWENVVASFALLTSGQASIADALNLVATLGGGLMLIVIWKKLPLEYTLYSSAMFLAPLLRMTTMQPLVSMSRYALAIFPIFILWGAWGKNPWVNRLIVYIAFPVQLFLCAQFFLWGWVA